MDLYPFLQSIWLRKWWVLAFAVLPSLLFGAVFYWSPRVYESQLNYNFPLDAVALQKINARFYSGENRQRLIRQLDQAALHATSERFQAVENEKQLRQLIHLRITPDYIDFTQKQNVKLSFERVWADNIEKLEKLTAEFLTIDLNGAPHDEFEAFVAVVRHNFEKTLPLYEIKDHLADALRNIHEEMAGIERNRIHSKLALEHAQGILARLRAIPPSNPNQGELNLNLTFEKLAEENKFLPLSLQIQSFESEVARFVENIAAAERNYIQRGRLRDVLRQLLGDLEENLSRDYDLEQYQGLLRQRLAGELSEDERDFLNAQLKVADNYLLARVPLAGQAWIQPVAKGTIRKTAYLFTSLLMIGIFAACFWEYLRYHRKMNA